MSAYKVTSCTLDDAPAIAHNNVSAFWEDKNWVLMWTRKNKSREYVISQAALRWPYNLVKDTTYRRREKTIEVSTGKLVGLCTWVLPKAGTEKYNDQEICDVWPEARVPGVDEEMLEGLKKRYNEADWDSDHAMDVLSPAVNELRARCKGDKKYGRKYLHALTFVRQANVAAI